MVNHQDIVYIIGTKSSCMKNCSRTYVGVTNNFKRRRRQHNGEIKGGARYTRGSKWDIIAIIGGLQKRQNALILEWCIKHRHHRGGDTPVIRRIRSLWTVLAKDKPWTRKGPKTKDIHETLWAWWNSDVVDLALQERNWEMLPPGVRPSVSVESLFDYLYHTHSSNDS